MSCSAAVPKRHERLHIILVPERDEDTFGEVEAEVGDSGESVEGGMEGEESGGEIRDDKGDVVRVGTGKKRGKATLEVAEEGVEGEGRENADLRGRGRGVRECRFKGFRARGERMQI